MIPYRDDLKFEFEALYDDENDEQCTMPPHMMSLFMEYEKNIENHVAPDTTGVDKFFIKGFIQEVYPVMSKQKSGLIVNILSSCCLFNSPLTGSYSASKDAMEGISKIKKLYSNNLQIKTVIILLLGCIFWNSNI